MPLFSETKAGILVYRHTQSTPLLTWTIVHNLGSKPLVELFVYDANGALQKAWPLGMEHIDNDTVAVTWSQGRTGFATLATHMLG
jgi:hypothetical protein